MMPLSTHAATSMHLVSAPAAGPSLLQLVALSVTPVGCNR